MTWISSATTWTLTFTNVRAGALDVGDRLTYEVNSNAHVVRFLDASAPATAEIGWNAATGAGYLLAPNYNGGARACWDASLQNVASP